MLVTITMWTTDHYECRLVVPEPFSSGGQLQLLEDGHVVLQQWLLDAANATLLALAWQRQHQPASLAGCSAA